MACLSAPHLRSGSIGRVYNVYGPIIWTRHSINQALSIYMAEVHHQPQDSRPLVVAPTDVLQFVRTTMDDKHPSEDYLELIHLAAIMVGLPVLSSIRRSGALNRARWMAKAIDALKIELLFWGNEEVLHLSGRQLQGLQRFNRFVILVYIQSWYTCSLAVDAAFNDIALILRLQDYYDVELSRIGLRMMVRHSWYLSPELASLVLFSNNVHDEVKVKLVAGMQQDRGRHLLSSTTHYNFTLYFYLH